MDRQTQRYFMQRLLEEKERLQEQIASLDNSGLGESLLESTQELSRYDNHPADLGSETFERGKDLALRDNARIRLKKIEDALACIREGNYGLCRRCGREIPRERLEAVPETTLCLNCRREMEGSKDINHRPVEEQVILPPFGGQFSDPRQKHPDEEEAIMYDGEDTWQELARTTEHASESRSGSYYGPLDLDEDRGYVEAVEAIPYFKGADGVFYEDTGACSDDEEAPRERVIGDAGPDRVKRDEGFDRLQS